MSAYDDDPRVTAQADGTYNVDAGTSRHVCPGAFGGYVTHSTGADDADGLGFDTADDAIRSLIGDPA
jgi:hypothetical protein